jgi:hypothetical protein
MHQVLSLARRYYGHWALTPRAVVIALLPVLFFAVYVGFWRRVIIDTAQTVTSQVDYEDEQLCTKFGFPRGTEKHNACKLDLLDLRRSDEDLMTRTSLP